MIQLSNGHQIIFVAASGSLGFDGDDAGHGLVKLWKKPARWFGLLDPKNYTIITKTLTLQPKVGNLKWWCPWRCVRRFGEGFINSVGLTNPGLYEWTRRYYGPTIGKGYKIALSIAPNDLKEAATMAASTRLTTLKALHLNPICPNVSHSGQTVDHYMEIIQAARYSTDLPIIVKLGWKDPYMEIISKALPHVQAWDLINAMPIGQYPGLHESSSSPLQKYGLTGAISGPSIAFAAREVLQKVKQEFGHHVKVISGGGIYDYEEMKLRVQLGADALSFGTLFLKKPCKPDRLVARFREEYGVPLEQPSKVSNYGMLFSDQAPDSSEMLHHAPGQDQVWEAPICRPTESEQSKGAREPDPNG